MSNQLLSHYLFYIPPAQHLELLKQKTQTQNVVLIRNLQMCDGCLCSRGPNTRIRARLLSSASVCARVHLSGRLMDLQEMALGIYYHM